MANRNFNKKQALEKEVKDLYLKMTVGTQIAATAILDLTADITLTSVATGSPRNGTTFTLEVEAAAANPTDTILADFTGTASAIICTITPNDGTNNSATPVNLTTAELSELINTGAVVGKNVTVTDLSSLRALQTASGGDSTNLADSGEGDGELATFSGGGANQPSIDSGYGISSVARNGTGDYSITLSDAYVSMKYARAIMLSSSAQDIRFQMHSESVSNSSSKIVRLLAISGTTPTDPSNSSKILVKLELKNSDVR